ncbi:squalene/phytoene synthase family protein [Streptomyces sp. NPDC056390]|uniref:squalene/phytoene synthase family protein n=1 Tax=Streptomyces sp. NPDC056390 TaxID=3345806 RepID=UPI0035DC2984
MASSLQHGLSTDRTTEPVVRALADTAHRYAIDPRHFQDFMTAMRDDLTVTDYATYTDLRRYMHGSAAVICLRILPVLGTTVPRAEAEPYIALITAAGRSGRERAVTGGAIDRRQASSYSGTGSAPDRMPPLRKSLEVAGYSAVFSYSCRHPSCSGA